MRTQAKLLLFSLFLILGWSAQGQNPIVRNYFTTNQNPQITFTNGTLVSTNIYVSNIFATNITVQNITNFNEFRGRTVFTTNLFSTNAFITYLTNITAYVTNLFAVTEYVTNLNVTYLTNQTFYTTNLFATTVNAVTNINNFDITTNLFVSNVFATNITVDLITNNTFFTTNIFATTVNATTNFNTFNFSTNLFSTNIITTNLFATFITNQTLFTTNIFATTNFNTFNFSTNLFSTNIITTNLFATYITNQTIFTTNLFATTINTTTNISNFNFSTNLISSNIFTTNIFVMEASWFTNRWVGPTNDVNFDATYQNFVASTDMEITGFQNSIATNANTSVLLLDPGGATRTLYFPAPWTNFTSDGNNAYVIPKTNTAILTLFQYGNLYTNVTFRLFGSGTQNTVSNSMYGLGFVQTNDTRILAFAGPIYDTNLTPGLPVFAQGAGLLGTSNSIPAGVLPNDIAYTDKNNAFTTASSNYFAGAISISTNSCNGVPDFSVEESLFSTNNAIVFAAPIGVDTTKKTVQWLLVNTTNTTAAAVTVTPPANCHGVGTLYCTNWSQCWFQCYGGAITNMIVVPIF